MHYATRNNALLDLGPKLKRFWNFKPNITKGKEVTCMAVHPTNGVRTKTYSIINLIYFMTQFSVLLNPYILLNLTIENSIPFQNLIAASYGSNNYTSPPEGLVCIWNIKNINFPERIFNFPSSVTVIAFSTLTPYLLAIGLLDGNIYVYDMRSAKPRAFCSTL